MAVIAGDFGAFDFVEECADFHDGLEEVDGFGVGGDGLVAEKRLVGEDGGVGRGGLWTFDIARTG